MIAPGYICPSCISHLDVEDSIVLSAKTSNGKRGVVLLSTTLGDYSVKTNAHFKIEQGERIALSCPVCSQELLHNSENNLCKIIRVDEKGEEHTVLFSNKYGEQCTFHLKGEKATSYGEHAIRFQDPEWFKQDDEK